MMDDALEELLCELMELPHDGRLLALEAMGDLSDESKAELRRMLGVAEQADAYFTDMSAAVKMLPKTSRMELEGDFCGPYKLVRKIGEGGFGLVWLAEQERPFKRTVAVKVIKAGMDTAEVLARFDAEKHALSRMDHPNIAKVLDAGVTDHGRPYFVMELVVGTSITRYCREHETGIPDRLRLFADVCSAINHAHQKGIIHRDIKPSNVIVTEVESKPVVKVIDFGIAKAIEGHLTEHTLQTLVGQWVGTPAYMSPEQAGMAAGDVDTRSDIYALGVLLYELLTGVAPFNAATLMKAGYEEMRRIIREEEPPRPSARIATTIREAASSHGTDRKNGNDVSVAGLTQSTVKGVSSELDWIVMKAMEKARERRYESAAALAGDVGRFLSDEPVEAKPPSTFYLLSKFTRRHRTGIHIASAFLVLVVGAVLLSIWLALRAYDAEQIARERLGEALEDRNAKNQALDEAEAISRLLADVLQRPQQEVDGRSVTIMQSLDVAAKKLDNDLSSQPQRQTMLRGVLADTYVRLGIFERSFELRKQNYEAIRDIHGPTHQITRHAFRKLVEAAEAMGDSQTSLELARIEIATLDESKSTAEEVAAAMRSIVRGWLGIGNRAKAIEYQRKLISHCITSYGNDTPQVIEANWELRQFEERAQNDEHIHALENQLMELTEAYGSVHPEVIGTRISLAELLVRRGYAIESLMHLQALRENTLRILGLNHDLTLKVHELLVSVYLKLSRHEDAVRAQQMIVAILRKRDGDSAATTVRAENRLERRLFYSDLKKEHATYCEELLQRRIGLFGENHVNTVLLRLKVGFEHPDDAKRNIENAIRVLREYYGSESRSTAEAIAALARDFTNEGRVDLALPLFVECGPNMLDDTWLNFECASLQLWTGDDEGYRQTRRNILRYWVQRIPRQRSQAEMFDRAMWLSCIAELDDDAQKQTVAKLLNHVRSIRQGLHIEAKERHSVPLQNQIHGIVLYRLGRYDESIAALQVALQAIESREYVPTGLDYQLSRSMIYSFMAMAHQRLEQFEAAQKWLDRGESFQSYHPPDAMNPKVEYFVGGDALARWITHREARQMLGRD